MNLDTHLEVAVSAVRDASAVCRRVQADLVNAGTVSKDDKSPVTVADFAAQAVVCSRLGAAFADLQVVGEEGSEALRGDADLLGVVAGHAGMAEADTLDAIDRGGWTPDGTTSVYWTLDPIDGTKGFLRGEQYAVALGLIADGKVVLGVLGCPNLDGGLLMVGGVGDGLAPRRLAVDGTGSAGDAVAVSTTANSADARFCESVESGHSDQGASAKIAATLGITREPYRIDSQCKYAAVARGDADIYLRLPTRPGYEEKVWDHAAGLAVVEAAGGRVTDIDGKPLDFTHGRTLKHNRGVVATNGHLHDAVIAAIAGV